MSHPQPTPPASSTASGPQSHVTTASASATAPRATATATATAAGSPSTEGPPGAFESVDERSPDDTADIDKEKWVPNAKAQAFYWPLFWKGTEAKNKALCLLCRKTVGCVASSNLLWHIKSHHKASPHFSQLAAKQKRKAAADQNRQKGTSMARFVTSKKPVLTKDARNDLLAQNIVKDLHAVSSVESPNFRRMIRGLLQNPKFQFPSAKVMSDHITVQADKVRDDVRIKVAGREVALTGDGWDSGSNGSFYSLTAHLSDKETGKLELITLACRATSERHTGEK